MMLVWLLVIATLGFLLFVLVLCLVLLRCLAVCLFVVELPCFGCCGCVRVWFWLFMFVMVVVYALLLGLNVVLDWMLALVALL